MLHKINQSDRERFTQSYSKMHFLKKVISLKMENRAEIKGFHYLQLKRNRLKEGKGSKRTSLSN